MLASDDYLAKVILPLTARLLRFFGKTLNAQKLIQ
jgi:hypothetical protein